MLHASQREVHKSLPRDDGSLAADEIAAMVGLSVGEVSDLLGTGSDACSSLSNAAIARISAAVGAIMAACPSGEPTRNSRPAQGADLGAQVAELLAIVSAELRGAENALQGGVELLPALVEEAGRARDAARVVRHAVQRAPGVCAAAQDAERHVTTSA